MKKKLKNIVVLVFLITLTLSTFTPNSSYANAFNTQNVKVRIYKYGSYGTHKEKFSMAQRAIVDNGTVITKENENYFLTIPVKDFTYIGINGKFKEIDINGNKAYNKNNIVKVKLASNIANSPANKIKVENVKVTSTVHAIVAIPSTHKVDFIIEK